MTMILIERAPHQRRILVHDVGDDPVLASPKSPSTFDSV